MKLIQKCETCHGTGLAGPAEDINGVPFFEVCQDCGGHGCVAVMPPPEHVSDEEKDSWARRFWRALFGKQEE